MRAQQSISPVLGRQDRLCVGADPDDFFPYDKESNRDAIARMTPIARLFCAPCPIREACRAEGDRWGFGLWGGVLYRPGYGGTLARNSRTTINLLTGRTIG